MGSDAPRAVILLSAWANIFAGITLCVSFFVYFLALQIGHCDPRSCNDPSAVNNAIIFNGRNGNNSWFLLAKWTMFTEGFLWCLGGALLCYRNICNANAAGAVSQCIISTGGWFFMNSAFGNPANVISLRYITSIGYFGDGQGGGTQTVWVSFADCCPFYGITTFMIATSMGMYSVRSLPKNKIVSPFYGVLCFFIGAWIIGVLTLFIPMLAGGEQNWESLNSAPCFPGVGDFVEGQKCMLDMPSFAWYQTKILSLIGGVFLLIGSSIFGIMDNALCLPAKNDKLLGADEA